MTTGKQVPARIRAMATIRVSVTMNDDALEDAGQIARERGLSVPAFLADCARRELIRQSLARHSAWCADAGLSGDEADERLARVLVEAQAEGRRLAAAAGD
jgi:hypothetical protein